MAKCLSELIVYDLFKSNLVRNMYNCDYCLVNCFLLKFLLQIQWNVYQSQMGIEPAISSET